MALAGNRDWALNCLVAILYLLLFSPSSHPALLAAAAETHRGVEAGGVTVTAVSPKLTFIYI